MNVRQLCATNFVLLLAFSALPAWSQAGNVAPFVRLAGPADGASYAAPASITLSAVAVDKDGGVARVEFYSGTTLIGVDASAPFSVTWTGVPVGNYTLTAKAIDRAGAHATSAAARVRVLGSTPPPSVRLDARPASVSAGGSSTLSWSSTNASACTASGAWTGSRTTSGSQSTGALTATGTYTLTCSGTGGSAVQSATVTVTPPAPVPAVTLTATPGSVSAGGSSTLTWSSTNASACTASGAWTGSRTTSGSQSTGALAATSTYTLTCSGPGGTAQRSATVSVATSLACADPNVLCVDDTAGATQEYANIQAAVNAVQAGQTVLVHDGNYAGFQITRSGNSGAPITVRAQGSAAVIDSAGPTGDGARLQNVSHVTLEGFTIRGMPQYCVAARGATATAPMTGNILRNNSCSGAGRACLYLSQFGNSLIENNTASACGTSGGSRNHGLYLANAGSDNTVIRGNSISDTRGSESNGIHLNGDLSIGGDGLISGVTIEGNVIFGHPQNGINMDGVQNTLLRNNLVYGNGRHAIRGYAIDGAAGPQSLRIVNNTLRASTSGWAVKLSADLGGHVVFNNVLLGGSGALSVANSAIDSNNNAGDDRYSADGDATTLTLAQWRSTTAQDADSLVASPAALFVDAAANDYRLSPLSVAVDAGRASLGGVNAPTSDRTGTARPQGRAFDIGAYEQTSTTPPLPTVSLTASPASVGSGGSSTLSWSSTNAASCTASGAWTGSKATSGSQSTGALATTSTYTLTCSGAGGSARQAATVTVTPPAPAPTVRLTATPASVSSGGSSTLNWSSDNASSCTASGAWAGSRATSGSQSTGALTATSTYTLACSGSGGSAVQAATVTVSAPAPAPTARLTATPASVGFGGSSTLSWSSTNASSCTASGAWTGSRATSGSQSTGALSATSTYALTCTGPGGTTALQSATVTVGPPASGSVFYIAASGGSDSYGGSEAAPWATFEHAWTVLKPGDTLIVKDGTYPQAMVPRMSGAAGNPITIRAQNIGRAIITPADNAAPSARACYNGEQNIAIHVYTCQGSNPRLVHDLVIDGFIARGKGENAAVSVGSSDQANLESEMTHNIVIRNTGAFGSITGTNNVVFSIGNNLRDSLFEDVFAYGAGRKAMSAFGSVRVTVRRAVVRYDFWTGNLYKPNDPRVSFSTYNTVDSVFENIIAMDDAPARGAETASRAGFVASGNATDVTGITASSNNKYLGIISLNNTGNGFELNGGSSAYPMSNLWFENLVSWGNTGSGINVQGNSAGAKFSHLTIGANRSIGLRLDPYPHAPITGTTTTNAYSYSNGHRGYSFSANQMVLFQNNSAYRNAEPNNIGGSSQGDIEVAYAPALTYLVNPAKVVGHERGATIVNRYVNGVQTAVPLWPWPNEDLIRSHMCNAADLASVDRSRSGMAPNWCLSNKTLTNYIWEYMGNATPLSVSRRRVH